MNIIKKLYCKYYYFQIKVGNRDIAPISAMFFLVFVIQLYFYCFLILWSFLIPNYTLNVNNMILELYHKYIKFAFPIALSIILYYYLISNKKYKKILKEYEEIRDNESSFWAVFLPIFGFLFLMLFIFLKMLQNQGKI